ncbi:hypothetical protein BDR26DRAFT_848684 [Obelidium mucronatum]|nr:hypothetical protein BDR26DRAFT_848684 [Obelidium mucronatum]
MRMTPSVTTIAAIVTATATNHQSRDTLKSAQIATPNGGKKLETSIPVPSSSISINIKHRQQQQQRENRGSVGSATRATTTERPTSILRNGKEGFVAKKLRHSTTTTTTQSQSCKRRISFSAAERVCPFDFTEPTAAIRSETLLSKPVQAPQEENLHVFQISHQQQQQQQHLQFTYSLISSTHKTPPLETRLKNINNGPIILESVYMIPSTLQNQSNQSTTTASLLFTFLVRNWHYDKQVSLHYTTTSWKQTHVSEFANFIGTTTTTNTTTTCSSSSFSDSLESLASSSSSTSTSPAWDRFSLELQVDTTTAAAASRNQDADHFVNIEFAVKCVFGGESPPHNEYWDNNNGSNHIVTLRGTPSCCSAASVNTIHNTPPHAKFLNLHDDDANAVKRRSTMLAVKRGFSMAKEAQEIQKEFEVERQWVLENRGTVDSLGVPAVMGVLSSPVVAMRSGGVGKGGGGVDWWSDFDGDGGGGSLLYAEPGMLMKIPLSIPLSRYGGGSGTMGRF